LLALQNYHLPKKALRMQFLSDPAQSVQVLSNTCDYFKIQNAALNIPKNSYEALPSYFIAQVEDSFKQRLILVKKTSNHNFSWTIDHSPFEEIETKEFLQNWNGFVFAVEKNVKTESALKFDFEKYSLPVVFCLMPTFYVFLKSNSLSESLIQLILSVGMLFSVYVVQEKYLSLEGEGNPICKLGKKTNCSSVINSKWSLLFKRIEMADASIIFFVTVSLFYSTTLNSYFVAILAATASLIIPYAVYHQVVSIKQWCPLCIGISISLLSILLISSLAADSTSIHNTDVLLLLTLFSFITLLWQQLKTIFQNAKMADNYQLKHLNLWRTPGITEQYVRSQPKLQVPLSRLFKTTYLNDKVNITIVANPSCGGCKKLHVRINDLLENIDMSIQLNHVFLVNPKVQEAQDYKMVSAFLQIKELNGVEQMNKAITSYYENKNVNKWNRTWLNKEVNATTIEAIFLHHDWCLNNGIQFTPCLIIENSILDINKSNDEISTIITFYHELAIQKQPLVANTFIPAG
jgi:uncharacterized membrane protein